MKKLKIVFMGTPEFAVHSLKRILDESYNVVGVVTAPDKPAGRGRKLKASAVKEFAQSRDLKILQPNSLKSSEFLEELKNLQADVQVVVAFRMLPEEVWKMPSKGTFNLHASLLPSYRGAAPINWAIINGEQETGVTTFFIDEKIDTGAIIFKEAVSIEPDENAGDLHDKLMILGSELVIKTLQAIEKDVVVTRAQKEAVDIKEAPKLNKENTRIDWNKSMGELHDFIRGLCPYPAAWTELLNGNEIYLLKIFSAQMRPEVHNGQNGEISAISGEIQISVPGGYLVIKELQLSGKKKLTHREFLNGFKFYPNAIVR